MGTGSSLSPQSLLPARYRDLGRLAHGGWGEVRLVLDSLMEREVAMKILAWEHLESHAICARFMNEARITAALTHPGVVPVHDQGVLSDGRPWFTMKRIDGPTLDAAIAATTPTRRLLDALVRICETVGFAHSKGIVHRDLKPANLMLGAFGEVLVLDWGIARRVHDRDVCEAALGTVLAGSNTGPGEVMGTPAYMAPEQARADVASIGPASDVFSLGLVLRYVLTGRDARSGSEGAVWGMALNGEAPASIDTRVPDELTAIYERAVRADGAERYADASAMSDALRTYLDGETRREKADGWVRQAGELEDELSVLRAKIDGLRERARAAKSALRDHDPIERKRPLWLLEDEAEALERRAALLDAERLESLRLALQERADHAPAHRELARTYRARLLEAEAAHRRADASAFELLLRRHSQGEHATFLAGRGRLTLRTAPAGARVWARRYELVDRHLVLGPAWELGSTPLTDVELPTGSYALEVKRRDREPMRYPVRIGRDENWASVRPGDVESTPVALLPAGALGDDEVYVPAGFAWLGGDAHAPEPVPHARRWVDGFVAQRFPVTSGAYLGFLNDLLASGACDEAERRAPRLMRGTHDERSDPRIVVVHEGRYRFALDEWGRASDPRRPIACVDWYSANAYAEWLSARSGLPWRLPNELEWEKAARGVDERAYPWGAHPEPTWACILGSTADAPSRVSVDAYPFDESPYGVRGLAGNVRDWCANVWRAEGPREHDTILALDPTDPDDASPRTIKGGAWNTVPMFARLAGRFASAPGEFFGVVGFRLVRSID